MPATSSWEKSYSLLVGPPEPYSGLISKLKVALGLVAGASIATAAANIGIMAGTYHLKETPDDWIQKRLQHRQRRGLGP